MSDPSNDVGVQEVTEDPFAQWVLSQKRDELAVAVGHLYASPEDTILIVARGDAPIASMPIDMSDAEKRRQVYVGLHPRRQVATALRGLAPSLADALDAGDSCGHRPILFASAAGASLQCGTCDHGLSPELAQA